MQCKLGSFARTKLVVLLLVCLAGVGTFCGCSVFKSATPSSKSTLWKLDGENNVVYLMGSMHLMKKEFYPLKPAILKAIDDSQVVVFEVDPGLLATPETQKLLLSSAMLPEGETLEGSISPESFEKLKSEFGKIGMHVGLVNGFKPWFATMTLAVSKMKTMGFSAEHGIEMYVYDKAKKQGKDLESLETVEFQFGLFNKLDELQSDSYLRQTLDDLDVMEEDLNAVVKCWQSGDEDGLAKLLLKSFAEYPEVQKLLVDDRNANWVSSIEEYLKSDKNYLVVGGAFHFPGEKGVLSLLKARKLNPEQL